MRGGSRAVEGGIPGEVCHHSQGPPGGRTGHEMGDPTTTDLSGKKGKLACFCHFPKHGGISLVSAQIVKFEITFPEVMVFCLTNSDKLLYRKNSRVASSP